MSNGDTFSIPSALRPNHPEIPESERWARVRSDDCAAAAYLLMEAAMRDHNRAPDGWTPDDLMHLAGVPAARVPFLFLAGCILATHARRQFSAGQLRRIFYAARESVPSADDLVEQTLLVAHSAFFFHKWWRSNINVHIKGADAVIAVRPLWERLAGKGDAPEWTALRLYLIGNVMRVQTAARETPPALTTVRDDELTFDAFLPLVLREHAADPRGFAPAFALVALLCFFRVMDVPHGRLGAVVDLALAGMTVRVPEIGCASQDYVIYSALCLAETLLEQHADGIADAQRAELTALASLLKMYPCENFRTCDKATRTSKMTGPAEDWSRVIEVGADISDRPYRVMRTGRMWAEPEEFAALMQLRGRTRTTVINLYGIYDEVWYPDNKIWPVNFFVQSIPSVNKKTET